MQQLLRRIPIPVAEPIAFLLAGVAVSAYSGA
jgi:hypothetical protein